MIQLNIKNCFIVRSEQWYDPTKVQYKELHGMLGFPVKLAKSFILSSKPTLSKTILFVLRWDHKFYTFLSVSVHMFIIQWFFSLKFIFCIYLNICCLSVLTKFLIFSLFYNFLCLLFLVSFSHHSCQNS